MTFAVITISCVLFGLWIGRWWALVAALWLGVCMGLVVDPWEVSKLYVGFAWTVVGLLGIAVGVGVRRLVGSALPGAGRPPRVGRS
jgi:hypothetical protein